MNYDVYIEYSRYFGYYISILDNETNNEYELDEDIAKLLGLSKEEYINLLNKYGAVPNSSNMFYFNKKLDIMNFKQLLENNLDGFLVAKALENNYV